MEEEEVEVEVEEKVEEKVEEERLDGFCHDVDLNLPTHWILHSSPRSHASPLKCGGKEE